MTVTVTVTTTSSTRMPRRVHPKLLPRNAFSLEIYGKTEASLSVLKHPELLSYIGVFVDIYSTRRLSANGNTKTVCLSKILNSHVLKNTQMRRNRATLSCEATANDIGLDNWTIHKIVILRSDALFAAAYYYCHYYGYEAEAPRLLAQLTCSIELVLVMNNACNSNQTVPVPSVNTPIATCHRTPNPKPLAIQSVITTLSI